MNQWS
jgi:hypothetical protein